MTINPVDVIHSDHKFKIQWIVDSVKDGTLKYDESHDPSYSTIWFTFANMSYPRIYISYHFQNDISTYNAISGHGFIASIKHFIIDDNPADYAAFGDAFYGCRFSDMPRNLQRTLLEKEIDFTIVRLDEVVTSEFEKMIQDFN